jgi:hypothetical protein
MALGARGSMVLATMLLGCGGARTVAATEVARQRAVVTGVAEDDAFFRAVHEMQVALNEAERVRIAALTRLGIALAQGDHADLEVCAAAVRDRARALLNHGVQLALAYEVPLPEEQQAPEDGKVLPTQTEAEGALAVEVRARTGSLPLDAEPFAEALRRAIRTVLALQMRMDAVARLAPELHTAGERLAARVPAGRPVRGVTLQTEYRDALEFLDGAATRAHAQSRMSERIVTRLQASVQVTDSGE